MEYTTYGVEKEKIDYCVRDKKQVSIAGKTVSR